MHAACRSRSIRPRKGDAANAIDPPHHAELPQPEDLTAPAVSQALAAAPAAASPPAASTDCRVLVVAIGIVAALAGGSWLGLCVAPALATSPAAGLAGVFPPAMLLVSVALQIDHAAGRVALRAFAGVFALAAVFSGIVAFS